MSKRKNPKVDSRRRYTIEIKNTARRKYIEGAHVPEIAKELNVPDLTVHAWKRRLWGGNWDLAREKLDKAKDIIQEKQSLEDWELMLLRQQKLFRASASRLAKKIIEAPDSDISTPTAVEGLQALTARERELYRPKADLLNPSKPGASVAIGARVSGGNAELMAYLTNSFNETYGTPKPEPERTALPDPENR